MGAERAKFDMKTWSVMKLFLCCRVCVLDRQKFRYKKSTRDDLYFMKGKEKMDRELDVGYIVHQLRVMRYFLKTVLDKDQRVILKLKTFEFINSSEEGKPDYEVFKKKLKKDKLLDRYIDKLKSKTLTV